MTGPEIVVAIEATLKRKGISKGKFYSECNVTAAMMSNWRRGKNLPLMDTMARINRFLGTDLILTSTMTNTERVCAICEIKGVPVSSLENVLGYPEGHLDPTKTRELPYADLMKIAAYFNLPISNLIYGPILPDEKSPAPVDGDEAERQEFIRLYQAAPAWLQDQVRSLLRAAEAGSESPDDDPKE